jgi:tetratricopeptide (TPR) repeat protein
MRGRRRARWGIAGFVCVFALGVFAQDTKTVRHHRVEENDPAVAKISEAEGDIGKQDYSTAEGLLKEAVAASPDNYLAWYDLGFVYRALGQRDESIAAYRKSVAARPDVFESNLNLGLELAQVGNPDAETFLRAATQLTPVSNPNDGKKHAWMALGQFLEKDKPNEAVAAYQQAAIVDARDPEPHLLAAGVLEKTRPTDADKEYEQALAVAPQSSDALAALTNFYTRQRRYSDAEAVLRKLVELHPNDAAAHLQLGRMLAIANKNDEAIAQMEAGLNLDPSDSHAQHDLADLCLEAGKLNEAERLYAQLAVAYPSDASYHQSLGHALLDEKKFPEAQREFEKAVQLKPDSGPAYGDLAVAANENKNYQLAIQAVDMRAKFLPEIPMTYFLRATAYDHLQDEKSAAKYYHQFLDVAAGKFPDQEWQATHRLIAIEPKK